MDCTTTAYVISEVDPVAPQDRDAWERYRSLASASIRQFGGRYLVRGGAIASIEGGWSPSALIIIAFPDMATAQRWYASAAYAEALKAREGSGLSRRLIFTEGVAADPT